MEISAVTEAINSSDDQLEGAARGSYQDREAPNSAARNGIPRALDNENKFQSAISTWRSEFSEEGARNTPYLKLICFYARLDIDLTKLVPELDVTASDIVNHQREALLFRKDLAQSTKDFRKLDDTAKLGELKSLLKGGIVVKSLPKS
jgi:homeobox protein cut-like